MALDYLTQGNGRRNDAKTIGADGLSGVRFSAALELILRTIGLRDQ
jgi:hypothetical protein